MIHIGSKITESKAGWVANFCPICRLPRAFQLFRFGQATTLYGVALSEGTLVAMQIECSECGTRLPADESQIASVEHDLPADFSYLVLQTFPSMPEVFAARFALEGRIRHDPKSLEPEFRSRMLLEPFNLLNPMLEQRRKSSHLDTPAAIGCLGTLLIMLAAVGLWFLVPREQQEVVGYTVLGLIGLGIVYTLVQIALAPGRYLHRRILPNLVRALAPLSPDREELQQVLDACRKRKMGIGRKLKFETLWTQLNPLRKS